MEPKINDCKNTVILQEAPPRFMRQVVKPVNFCGQIVPHKWIYGAFTEGGVHYDFIMRPIWNYCRKELYFIYAANGNEWKNDCNKVVYSFIKEGFNSLKLDRTTKVERVELPAKNESVKIEITDKEVINIQNDCVLKRRHKINDRSRVTTGAGREQFYRQERAYNEMSQTCYNSSCKKDEYDHKTKLSPKAVDSLESYGWQRPLEPQFPVKSGKR